MKQLTLRENRIVDVIPQFLHYTADTLGGSSGSPVYNDRWEVVALHHSGIWKTNAKGEPLAVDGQVWRQEMGEDKIAWLYNEGARVSSLVAHMQQQPLDGSRQALMREMLQREPTFPIESVSPPSPVQALPASPYVAQVQSGVATWTIPLQISMSIGSAPVSQIPDGGARQIVGRDSASGKDLLPPPTPPGESEVLTAAKQALRRPGVMDVRMGYRFVDGEITKERAIVVTVRDKQPLSSLREAGIDPLPSAFRGYPVEVVGPTIRQLMLDQSKPLGNELFGRLQAIAEEIIYVPPQGVQLKKVTAQMRVVAHVSPDIGWPTLKRFLGNTKTRLVVGMYDFGAPHIVTAAAGIHSGRISADQCIRISGSVMSDVAPV
jgi:hypothetical protein